MNYTVLISRINKESFQRKLVTQSLCKSYFHIFSYFLFNYKARDNKKQSTLYILNIKMMINQEKGKEEVREYKVKGGYSAKGLEQRVT